MSSVYYNHETRMLAIKECNQKQNLLTSDYKYNADDLDHDKHGNISRMAKYTGSDFHMTVQKYLAHCINLNKNFKDKHRSKFNQ